jgi:hypothetical protein
MDRTSASKARPSSSVPRVLGHGPSRMGTSATRRTFRCYGSRSIIPGL